MNQKIILFCLLLGFLAKIYGQTSVPDSLALLFHQQLMTYPQEKIYLHTDKPYYISGERIWLRAHIADAVTHIPFPISRYVYVELINPLDSVLTRIKILQKDEAYHGHLLIPDDAPEGDYMLRAYTTFMRSQNEHYFFTKNVRISVPQTRIIHTETQFTFESDKKIHATFRFSSLNFSRPLVPQTVKISVNDGQPMNVKVDDNGMAGITFNLPATSRKRIIRLDVVADNMPYQQFIQVPVPDDDFDVSFFPEGGSLMQGVSCKMAFKALKSNGNSTDITGVIYDQSKNKIQEIKSDYLGMGKFLHLAEKGKTYYAICENDKGRSKRFELPVAFEQGYALSVSQTTNRIMISVLKPEETIQNENLYLIAHIRGMIYLAVPWNHEKNVVIQKDQSPSGVMHIILFDADMNPVSERLVFINNNDEAKVTSQPDKTNYAARSFVEKKIILTDQKGQPLLGNFSISVTSDREVTPDSTSNILTQLLLTSDLHGFIENPAYYFQNTPESAWALDMLMLTQGWRRYDIAELAQNRFSQPAYSFETSTVISGTVKSTILNKPVGDLDVNIWSLDGKFFESAKTDNDGRFYFQGDFPDSTRFIVSAVPRRGLTSIDLIPDNGNFPEKTLPTISTAAIDRNQLAKYADKAEQMYVHEHGVRINYLSELTITAELMPRRKSQILIHEPPPRSHTFSEKDIENFPGADIFTLLEQVPGVIIVRGFTNIPVIRKGIPSLVVDDSPVDLGYLNLLDIQSIEQIEVVKIAGAIPFFSTPHLTDEDWEIVLPYLNMIETVPASASAIMIYTKKGVAHKVIPPSNTKTIIPLGYQTPVEFYAPKYDTPEKQKSPVPDLRTTLHWQPVVQTDSQGVASFDFYTADETSPFTVIIEGISNNGTIIRYEE